MARRRMVVLATLLCVIVVGIAFAAGDWVGQRTEAIALATPTPNYVGNDISPDTLGNNELLLQPDRQRAIPQFFPSGA